MKDKIIIKKESSKKFENIILPQWKDLKNKIIIWENEYHNLDNPSVSDKVYDAALFRLNDLETKYQKKFIEHNINLNDSPTKKLFGKVDPRFQKHDHIHPMLSLNKAYSLDELQKFEKNIIDKFPEKKINFYCEPKIDGISISLHYKKGLLHLALTRGNGQQGEDVTQNVFQIKSIPKKIDYKKEIEVRGEIYLNKSDLIKINTKIKSENEDKKPSLIYSNTRNLASGTMRQLDSEIVKERNLQSFIYSIIDPLSHGFKTYTETLDFLSNNGFVITEYGKLFDDVEKCYEYIFDKIENIRQDWEYETDGMVIKLNQLDLYEKVGGTTKFPHSMIAYKFEDNLVTTKLNDIKVTIGRTGLVTYNAELEPVLLDGSIVSAAILHNYTIIEKMKISIGDIVEIKKAGNIIPKVVRSLNNNNQTNFAKVLLCPFCNQSLIETENGINQFCKNILCPEIQKQKIVFFASKFGLNIEHINIKLIELLIEQKLISDAYDLYNLKNHREQMLKWKGFQETSVDKILTSIENSKNTEIHKIISAVGIKNIGVKNAKIIAEIFPDIKKYVDIDFSVLENHFDFGPVTIKSIKDFFSDEKNLILWNKLMSIEWNFSDKKEKELLSKKLKNEFFCITGTFSLKRKELIELIENHGGIYNSSVTKNTTILIAGDKPGSSLDKAKKLNLKIINENDFNNLIS